MSRDHSFAPDIRIDQQKNRAVISGPDLVPVEFSLRDPDIVRIIVTRQALGVEKAQPLGLPGRKHDAKEFLAFAKRAAYRCLTQCTTTEDYGVLQGVLELFMSEMARAALRQAPLRVEITDHSGEYFPWEWLGELDPQRTT